VTKRDYKLTEFGADFMLEAKKQRDRGRCLHFDDGIRCNRIISAHSIQKKSLLSLIAEEGHVYRLSTDPSVLGKTGGIPIPKKMGIKSVSTFAGFCKHHDNSLFRIIDNETLLPSKEQAAIYAYRSICREYFVKENAIAALQKFKHDPRLTPSSRSILDGMYIGNSIGFNGLRCHKQVYDVALCDKEFSGFDYVCFVSSSKCPFLLSGLLYPDFDFEGNFLQQIGIDGGPVDLITYFTAPMACGWSFCFAWHTSSSRSCIPFLGSLANMFRSGKRIEDMLLRLAFSCSENHAIRISWWDSMADEAKSQLIERMHMMVLPDVPVPSHYLARGCEGMANWEVDYVYDSREETS
jgi:hypothetical protein